MLRRTWVGLLGDVAVDQLAGGRVLAHLPGQEKQAAAAPGHRERLARCWAAGHW